MKSQNDLLSNCELIDSISYREIYNVRNYTRRGLYVVYNLDNNTFNTVLYDGKTVLFIQQCLMNSPLYNAFEKHRSYVHSVNVAGDNETSKESENPNQLTMFSIEDSDKSVNVSTFIGYCDTKKLCGEE